MSRNRSRPITSNTTRWSSNITTSPPLSPPVPPLLQQQQQEENNNNNNNNTIDIVHSSIEQSLQDWLSRSISDNSPILDTKCGCCGQSDCESFESLGNTIKKLEGDARLAAGKEIGQSLLHKHESYIIESNQVNADLEQQLDEARQKAEQLNQLLEDADCTRRELLDQHNKVTWESQKTQKTLRETAADLEVANARCTQLMNELRTETMEVDKLRIFKFMVRQADVREETLRAKLEDTKQELAISRKTELTLESKHRKLKSRYETVCSAYERLKLSQQEFNGPDNLNWLRESNEKLRKDVLKLTSKSIKAAAMIDIDSQQQQPGQQQPGQQQQFITFIKELASANNKLKTDLLECRDLLSETRHEVITLNNRIEDLENNNNGDEQQRLQQQWPTRGHERVLSTSAPSHDDDTLIKWPSVAPSNSLSSRKQQKTNYSHTRSLLRSRRATSSLITPPKDPSTIIPSPTASTSTPTQKQIGNSIVHHHFHYHMQQQQSYDSLNNLENDTLSPLQKKDINSLSKNTIDNDKNRKKNIEEENKGNKLPLMKNSVSFSSQATSTINSIIPDDDDNNNNNEEEQEEEEEQGTPYYQLKQHVTKVLQRLRATDIRALNRRLKRAFDILELSTMSNSIIDNILMDVDTLHIQFSWLNDNNDHQEEEEEEQEKTTWHHLSMQEFFPTLQIMQEMLQEIGQLRSTMNDLQVEYFKKVEENDIRVEQEVIRKREIQRRRTSSTTLMNHSSTTNIVTWLSNVFFQSRHQQDGNDNHLVRSISHDSIMDNNNKPNSSTTVINNSNTTTASGSKIIRHKRSDMDRHGPPSSYPRVSTEKRYLNNNNNNINMNNNNMTTTTSSSSNSQPRPIPYPKLRTSKSSGGRTVRKSKSMQAPALEYAAVKRKKSLGLTTSLVDLGTSPDIDVDWKVGSAFGTTTSWLGNK
ncbi:hypothetical protein INT45_000264 [Circinella minor]|uniref:Uncharacterized protein n=1 Tax=Circinella minor TaxID=1195481 RepID=A0A8H7S8V4_9FUNG|nr:hypothetical protein INT45_000264 [Circinella minor]